MRRVRPPIELFIESVRVGRTPSRKVLVSVARLLETMSTERMIGGRPRETRRRAIVLNYVEKLRLFGGYTIDRATADVCSVSAFKHSLDTVRNWYESSHHPDERKTARAAAAEDLRAYRSVFMLNEKQAAHLLLSLANRELEYYREHGFSKMKVLPDGRLALVVQTKSTPQ